VDVAKNRFSKLRRKMKIKNNTNYHPACFQLNVAAKLQGRNFTVIEGLNAKEALGCFECSVICIP